MSTKKSLIEQKKIFRNGGCGVRRKLVLLITLRKKLQQREYEKGNIDTKNQGTHNFSEEQKGAYHAW